MPVTRRVTAVMACTDARRVTVTSRVGGHASRQLRGAGPMSKDVKITAPLRHRHGCFQSHPPLPPGERPGLAGCGPCRCRRAGRAPPRGGAFPVGPRRAAIPADPAVQQPGPARPGPVHWQPGPARPGPLAGPMRFVIKRALDCCSAAACCRCSCSAAALSRGHSDGIRAAAPSLAFFAR